jgi:CRISPR system Cascade subunit CasA
MTVPPSYDLTTEPWIPVVGLDGAVQELSLVDVVGHAHELVAIGGELPTHGFALTRLVLAVLHRSVGGPADRADWADLWQAGELPVDDVARYLAGWRHRFDLFHPETPFLQVAGLATAKGEFSGLEKLIADVPNGHAFFTARAGRGVRSLDAPEAARWLVHTQAFDPSGIKSGAVDDPRVTGGKGYPIGIAWAGNLGGVLLQGTTLRETLLLNLLPYADDALPLQWAGPEDDLPVWEREPLTGRLERESGRPRGPADLYTWPSRRIRLVPDADRVTAVLIANGDPLPVQNGHTLEPMTAWRRSPAQEKKLGTSPVYMPREHLVDRAFWRGLAALLPSTAAQRAAGAATLPPATSEWLAALQVLGLAPMDQVVRARAVGIVYGSNNSVVDDVIDDELSLQVALLQSAHPAVGLTAVDAVVAAEGAVAALTVLGRHLVEAAGGDGGGAGERARELGFAALDSAFRRWVAGLGADTDLVDAEAAWHRQVWRAVRSLGDELLDQSGPAAWAGRMVNKRHLDSARADLFFSAALAKAVPRAVPDHTQQPTEETS